jgi:hypothetical protein
MSPGGDPHEVERRAEAKGGGGGLHLGHRTCPVHAEGQPRDAGRCQLWDGGTRQPRLVALRGDASTVRLAREVADGVSEVAHPFNQLGVAVLVHRAEPARIPASQRASGLKEGCI